MWNGDLEKYKTDVDEALARRMEKWNDLRLPLQRYWKFYSNLKQ